jgi:hypothetical protein
MRANTESRNECEKEWPLHLQDRKAVLNVSPSPFYPEVGARVFVQLGAFALFVSQYLSTGAEGEQAVVLKIYR